MIRKPLGADRPSSLRQTAEAAIGAGREVRRVGRRGGRALQRLAGGWLLLSCAVGAITASSTGAKLLGLTLTGGLAYLLHYMDKRRRALD